MSKPKWRKKLEAKRHKVEKLEALGFRSYKGFRIRRSGYFQKLMESGAVGTLFEVRFFEGNK